MSKTRARPVEDQFDDAALFADEDFELDEFIDETERRLARREMRRRHHAMRRLEVAQEERWLRGQLTDWDDYRD